MKNFGWFTVLRQWSLLWLVWAFFHSSASHALPALTDNVVSEIAKPTDTGQITTAQITTGQTSPESAGTVANVKQSRPLRLVVLAPHLVELLFSLDAGEQIIATSEHADFPEAAKLIPRVGNYTGLQLEKIVALKPDAVLVWQSGTPAADVHRLKQLGMTVESFEPASFEDIARDLERLGQILGVNEKAHQLATEFRLQLQALRLQYASRTAITVFYELWDSPLSSIGAQAWPNQHLQLCGARNVLQDQTVAYPQLSIEQVIRLNPQLIIQPVSENEPRNLVNWQPYPQIQAVKNQQLIKPDSDLLHRATLRSLTATAQLCQSIERSRQFYQTAAQSNKN